MANGKKMRYKDAEKAVKDRLAKTHLKSYKILGSEMIDDVIAVYVLRMVGVSNYLFKINCVQSGSRAYEFSGFIPLNTIEEIGEYRVYNPQPASAEVLKPYGKEKKFAGYR